MKLDLLYSRNERPFGVSWEDWVAIWCNWMLSIPKEMNPTSDTTGRYCCVNQVNENVWFLTGTFGNVFPVKRKCTIPVGKAIFFPILEKEDSLAEDSDLKNELDLLNRSRTATDELISMELSIDNAKIDRISDCRVQSMVFDLDFPPDNVYDVRPGLTRSVSDGYWVFIKPFSIGKHYIHFKGETALVEPHTLSSMKEGIIFDEIKEYINKYSMFRLEVTYELNITN
jgi:hypothetical protein